MASSLTLLLAVTLAVSSAHAQTQTPTPQDEEAAKAEAKQKKKREARRKRAEQPQQPMRARRPYQAVFGGTSAVPDDLTQTLDVTGIVSESYDQNLFVDLSGPTATTPQQSGFYTHMNGELAYNRIASRLQFNANGGATARYYTDLSSFHASDYHAGVGLSGRATRRTTFTANQTFGYAPVYFYGLFVNAFLPELGQGRPPGTDYAVGDERSYNGMTAAQLNHAFSARSNVVVTGGLHLTRYVNPTPLHTGFTEQNVGADYLYQFGRDGHLDLAYTFRSANYENALALIPGQNPKEHAFGLGIDFSRVMSETRRTSFALRGGTIIAEAPVAPLPVEGVGVASSQLLRVLAEASVVHQFGETWQMSGTYKRGTGFIEGVRVPVFTDGWSIGANGLLAPRADLFAEVSYSTGDATRVGADVAFSSFATSVRYRWAISPKWAWTNEYVYYAYDFSRSVVLLPGTPPRMKRNVFRTGITFWVPWVRR